MMEESIGQGLPKHWFATGWKGMRLVDADHQAWILDSSGTLVDTIGFGVPSSALLRGSVGLTWIRDPRSSILYVGKFDLLRKIDLEDRGVRASIPLPGLLGLSASGLARAGQVFAFTMDSMFALDTTLRVVARQGFPARNLIGDDGSGRSTRKFTVSRDSGALHILFDSTGGAGFFYKNHCGPYARLCCFELGGMVGGCDSTKTMESGAFHAPRNPGGFPSIRALDVVEGPVLRSALRSAFRFQFDPDDYTFARSADSVSKVGERWRLESRGDTLVVVHGKEGVVDRVPAYDVPQAIIKEAADGKVMVLEYLRRSRGANDCPDFDRYTVLEGEPCRVVRLYTKGTSGRWSRAGWTRSADPVRIWPSDDGASLVLALLRGDSLVYEWYSSTGKPIMVLARMPRGITRGLNPDLVFRFAVSGNRVFIAGGDSVYQADAQGAIVGRHPVQACDQLQVWGRDSLIVGLCNGILAFAHTSPTDLRSLHGMILGDLSGKPGLMPPMGEEMLGRILLWDEGGHYLTRSFQLAPLAVVEGGRSVPVEVFADRLFRPDLWESFVQAPAGRMESRALADGLPSVPALSVRISDVRLAASLSPWQVDARLALAWGGDAPSVKVFLEERLQAVIRPKDHAVWVPDLEWGRTYTFKVYDANGILAGRIDTTFDLMEPSRGELLRLGLAPSSCKRIGGGDATRRRFRHLGIGVDRHANPDWNLRFAASDAMRLGAGFSSGCDDVFQAVDRQAWAACQVPRDPVLSYGSRLLLSSLEGGDSSSLPTKSRIRDAIRENAANLGPNDFFVMTFSGHGFTDDSGEYYLVPSDFAAAKDAASASAHRSEAISTKELAEWLGGMRARTTLILDACHAGASIGEGGLLTASSARLTLGQLAKEKKMLVLSATQSQDVALESDRLASGLLTSALVDFAPRDSRADLDGDGRIGWMEWLLYPSRGVPELAERISRGAAIGRGLRPSNSSPQGSLQVQRPFLLNFSEEIAAPRWGIPDSWNRLVLPVSSP